MADITGQLAEQNEQEFKKLLDKLIAMIKKYIEDMRRKSLEKAERDKYKKLEDAFLAGGNPYFYNITGNCRAELETILKEKGIPFIYHSIDNKHYLLTASNFAQEISAINKEINLAHANYYQTADLSDMSNAIASIDSIKNKNILTFTGLTQFELEELQRKCNNICKGFTLGSETDFGGPSGKFVYRAGVYARPENILAEFTEKNLAERTDSHDLCSAYLNHLFSLYGRGPAYREIAQDEIQHDKAVDNLIIDLSKMIQENDPQIRSSLFEKSIFKQYYDTDGHPHDLLADTKNPASFDKNEFYVISMSEQGATTEKHYLKITPSGFTWCTVLPPQGDGLEPTVLEKESYNASQEDYDMQLKRYMDMIYDENIITSAEALKAYTCNAPEYDDPHLKKGFTKEQIEARARENTNKKVFEELTKDDLDAAESKLREEYTARVHELFPNLETMNRNIEAKKDFLKKKRYFDRARKDLAIEIKKDTLKELKARGVDIHDPANCAEMFDLYRQKCKEWLSAGKMQELRAILNDRIAEEVVILSDIQKQLGGNCENIYNDIFKAGKCNVDMLADLDTKCQTIMESSFPGRNTDERYSNRITAFQKAVEDKIDDLQTQVEDNYCPNRKEIASALRELKLIDARFEALRNDFVFHYQEINDIEEEIEQTTSWRYEDVITFMDQHDSAVIEKAETRETRDLKLKKDHEKDHSDRGNDDRDEDEPERGER